MKLQKGGSEAWDNVAQDHVVRLQFSLPIFQIFDHGSILLKVKNIIFQ